MLPQVSVVVPCRDAGSWLSASLASLRHQQGVELELVLVDDGSGDDSPQLARTAWQGSSWPLRLLQSGGQGVSAARNLGWRAARHPLVAFLDADDLALPGRLRRQADLLLANRSLQQVLCGWQRIDPSGTPLTEVRPWQEGAGFSLREALRHKAVLPSAWMLRREALEAVGGFDATLSQAEDVDLLLRLARAGAPGAWLEEILCSYRVHPGAASRRARPQARGLSYVVERQLKALPATPEDRRLTAEVRYGTRAWLGWYAWICGDQPLALELWTTALGLSPFPPGLTWVHLAENVVRSAARIGVPAQLDRLLASPLWRELEQSWWRSRQQPCLGIGFADTPELNWQGIHRGQQHTALLTWSRQFRADLRASAGASAGMSWEPVAMAAWCLPEGPLGALRREVLHWSAELLALQVPEQDGMGPTAERLQDQRNLLLRDLARIVQRWATLTWQEDRRPTQQRLEQWVALLASPAALAALARLQSTSSPAGRQALLQLAAARPFHPDGNDPGSEPSGLPPAPETAFWEIAGTAADHCHGPQCPPCIQQLIGGWQATAQPHNLVAWRPPSQPSKQTLADAQGMQRQLAVLPGGEAWLRPPSRNAWHSTHAFTIAEHTEAPLAEFSRRYPQPWPGICPNPQPAPQPPPPGEPHWIEATVIVLVGLSAETYYHWLLETLPTLGWLATHHPEWLGRDVRIWHNGGSAPYVRETLQQCCGIRPEQLLDARELPWIRARRLIAVSPAPFGQPSTAAQAWLRRALLPAEAAEGAAAAQRVIWLRRGASARRPVFGEDAALKLLLEDGVVPVDCARLTVLEQASLLAEASMVITPHGGAMANLVFAAAGTTVLELHHPDYRPPYYQILAGERDLLYFSQSQRQRPPALYRDLLFESPATEPIVLETELVVDAVRSLL